MQVYTVRIVLSVEELFYLLNAGVPEVRDLPKGGITIAFECLALNIT
jgi:hypothetical protein